MEPSLTTRDWELFDIVHTVLPTELSLDDFYEEYSRLWAWALEVRFKNRSKLKFYLQLAGALATRRVTWKAVHKGMNLAKVFSDPQTFLDAHSKG